ncbi:MAG: ABC transporter substrate-binding protein [Limnochordia bacterium]
MRGLTKGAIVFLTVILSVGGLMQAGYSAPAQVRVFAPPGFAVLPLAWARETGALPGVDLRIELSPDHQRSLNLLATDQADFLITGLNVGAKAYTRGIGIQLVNVNTWAIDYVVARDPQIKSWADLIGKRVSLPLQGGPLDFLVQYLVSREGIDSSKIEFVYTSVPQSVQFFALGQIDAVVIPEPQVSQVLRSDPKASIVLDIQKEWAKWHRGDPDVPYVGLFVRKSYAEANPEIADQVAQVYAQGVDWMNAHPQEAAKLAERVLGMPEPVIQQALGRTKMRVYDGARTKALTDEHLEEMLQFNADLVGGRVPDDGFYR